MDSHVHTVTDGHFQFKEAILSPVLHPLKKQGLLTTDIQRSPISVPHIIYLLFYIRDFNS